MVAECGESQSAIRQHVHEHVHHEYILATVDGREGSANVPVFRRDGWPGLAWPCGVGWGTLPQLGSPPMDTLETPD